jgi:hypothetical protein
MRKLLTWLLVSLGIAALIRKLLRRGEAEELAPATATGEDPADELRRKLDETRAEDQEEAPAAEDTSVEERRAEVYEQGRATLDEMQQPDES